MNELQTFINQKFGSVRIINIEGKSFFVANDIAKTLGYKNPSDATNKHCKKSTMIWGSDSLGRQQEFKVIPEGDVYRLIYCSKLPSAEEFETWVFEIVLPQLRKNGCFKIIYTVSPDGKSHSTTRVTQTGLDYICKIIRKDNMEVA